MTAPPDRPRIVKRKLAIRPQFYQTDMMGVIHNSEFFRWFEEGRLHFFADILSFEDAMREGIALPVVRNVCDYLKPVRYGDNLVLATEHEVRAEYGGRLSFRHSLANEDTKVEAAVGETVVTLVDMKTGRLIRELPGRVRDRYLALK